MLVNMADKLQNTSQFFRRCTIRPDPLDVHSEVLTLKMILVTIYNELFEPKLRPWIDPHGLALMAMCVVSALNCQDYNILSHPLHLPKH